VIAADTPCLAPLGGWGFLGKGARWCLLSRAPKGRTIIARFSGKKDSLTESFSTGGSPAHPIASEMGKSVAEKSRRSPGVTYTSRKQPEGKSSTSTLSTWRRRRGSPSLSLRLRREGVSCPNNYCREKDGKCRPAFGAFKKKKCSRIIDIRCMSKERTLFWG